MKTAEEIKQKIEKLQNTIKLSLSWSEKEAIKFNEGVDYFAQVILNYIDGKPNENN